MYAVSSAIARSHCHINISPRTGELHRPHHVCRHEFLRDLEFFRVSPAALAACCCSTRATPAHVPVHTRWQQCAKKALSARRKAILATARYCTDRDVAVPFVVFILPLYLYCWTVVFCSSPPHTPSEQIQRERALESTWDRIRRRCVCGMRQWRATTETEIENIHGYQREMSPSKLQCPC